MKSLMVRFGFPLVGIFILLALVVIGVHGIIKKNPEMMAAKIHKDLQQLLMVFEKINKDCSILAIDNTVATIDFLTIEKPLGVEVGCLTLAYPEKWQGQYLKKNLKYQDFYYQIIQAHDGLYIVPGNGAQLPNGFIMGQDIEITKNTDLHELLKPGGMLTYGKNVFAIVLHLKEERSENHKKLIQSSDALLKEFNAAMPFVKNFKEYGKQQSASLKNQC